jgi:hypothetical protein
MSRAGTGPSISKPPSTTAVKDCGTRCNRKLRSHSRPIRSRAQLRAKAACRDVLHPAQATIAVGVRVDRYHGFGSRCERVEKRPHADADEDCARQRRPRDTLHFTLFSRKSRRSDAILCERAHGRPNRIEGAGHRPGAAVRTRLLRLCETIGQATARCPSALMHAVAHPRRVSCWPAGTKERCSILPALDSWRRHRRA